MIGGTGVSSTYPYGVPRPLLQLAGQRHHGAEVGDGVDDDASGCRRRRVPLKSVTFALTGSCTIGGASPMARPEPIFDAARAAARAALAQRRGIALREEARVHDGALREAQRRVRELERRRGARVVGDPDRGAQADPAALLVAGALGVARGELDLLRRGGARRHRGKAPARRSRPAGRRPSFSPSALARTRLYVLRMIARRWRLPVAVVAALLIAEGAVLGAAAGARTSTRCRCPRRALFRPAELERARDYAGGQRLLGLGAIAAQGAVLVLLVLRPPRRARGQAGARSARATVVGDGARGRRR